jgi:hypothetical protein
MPNRGNVRLTQIREGDLSGAERAVEFVTTTESAKADGNIGIWSQGNLIDGGAAGAGGGAGQWIQESPAGTRDGSNKVFTLSHYPLVSTITGNRIVILSLNGSELTPFAYAEQGFVLGGGEYAINGLTVTLLYPVKADDYLIATYFAGDAGSGGGATITAIDLFHITEHRVLDSFGFAVASGDESPYQTADLTDYLNPWFGLGSYMPGSTTAWPVTTSGPHDLTGVPYPFLGTDYQYGATTDAGYVFSLNFEIFEGVGNPNQISQLLVYDVWIRFTFSNGKTVNQRPVFHVSANTDGVCGALNDPFNYMINGEKAYDGDPATYAEIHRDPISGPMADQPNLKVYWGPTPLSPA